MKPVLIIEDDPEDLEAIAEGFADHCPAGALHSARDGDEAVSLLFNRDDEEQLDPAVILLDLSVPRVRGLDVLEQLKSDKRTAHVPVVIFTAANEEGNVDKAYHHGVNAYVVKPVSRADFVKSVGRIATFWLERNQPAPIRPA